MLSYSPDDVVPLLPTRPATCVPWPYGSCALTFLPVDVKKSNVAATLTFAFGRTPESTITTPTPNPVYVRGSSASVFRSTSRERYDAPSVRTTASADTRATARSAATARSDVGVSSAVISPGDD